MTDSHVHNSGGETPIGIEVQALLASGNERRSAAYSDRGRPGQSPVNGSSGSPFDRYSDDLDLGPIRMAAGMSIVNYAIFIAWLYANVPSVSGFILGSVLGFALGIGPVAALIRRITGWKQSICFPFGMLLGSLLGFVIGALYALHVG